MTTSNQDSDFFEAIKPPDKTTQAPLIVDIAGFEGPLDLLLTLARSQKVDLKQISILELVEQFLQFIADTGVRHLEKAADYLVMAAWLAYLKSRLLLPEEKTEDDMSAAEMAAQLTWQLQRLQAIREAAAKLMARDQMGRDLFGRGQPEAVIVTKKAVFDLGLYDLLQAYAEHKAHRQVADIHIHKRRVYRLDQALLRLNNMIGSAVDWVTLFRFLPNLAEEDADLNRSAKASLFTAALELARQGRAEITQEKTFGPLLIRSRNGQS